MRGNPSWSCWFFDQSSIEAPSPGGYPLFVLLRDEATLRPPTRITPAGGSGNMRHFCLPTGLPLTHAPLASQTSSQAEDTKFKTRLASYNDDELNSPNASSWKMAKEEGCPRTTAGGHVVANHASRRQSGRRGSPVVCDNRNASRPRGCEPGGSQVLTGVPGPSPQFDGGSVGI